MRGIPKARQAVRQARCHGWTHSSWRQYNVLTVANGAMDRPVTVGKRICPPGGRANFKFQSDSVSDLDWGLSQFSIGIPI